ncbi:MAG TPA: NAD-dependent epimerase/dehydratase family protein [Xanthobacteraceae bacterium]|jgi:UDP-glucose 4-epimerase|nr:NAD-dependent epimerase/dehydratase family protein [Xanthobacteraceae bacterium]
MTRVLVTGATGFVGRPLVAHLAATGYGVRAVVRRSPSPPLTASVEVTQGDLGEPIAWEPQLRAVDAVVHLAGIAHASRGIAQARYDQINHQATAALARAAARAGVKHFVFVSSVRAQSGPAADHVLTERDAPRPSDPYGRSKLAAEAAVAASGVPFTILRPVLIYGPSLKGNLATLARLASWPLPLPFGAFANRRSLLGIDNLVSAIMFVLQNPATRGEIFLVADRTPISLAEIVTAFCHGVGRRPHLFSMPPRPMETIVRLAGGAALWERIGGELVVDPAKLMAAGWSPATDTKAALMKSVQASSRPA